MLLDIIDSLSKQIDPIEEHTTIVSYWAFNAWTCIALFEFICFFIFLYVASKTKKRLPYSMKVKKVVLSETVDFGNIVNSAFHATDLFNKLKVKCHPDRFPNDPEKNAIALELFQLINKNRNNVKILKELKYRAEKELNITI